MARTIKKYNTFPKFVSKKEIKKQNRIDKLLNKLDIEKLILILDDV